MSNRSAAALGRSYGTERGIVGVIGFLLFVAGVLALVVAQGWVGAGRATRSVLDPLAVGFLGQYLLYVRIVAIVVGLLLLIFGLRWFFRTFRPEGRPNLRLDDPDADGARTTVTSSAIADAVASDCEQIPGVGKVRVRAVGKISDPALRLNLLLNEGTDVREVWRHLDETVLANARTSLGLKRLPTAVRIEVDSAPATPRVE